MPTTPVRRTVAAAFLFAASLLASTPSADHPRFAPEIADFVRNFKAGGQDFTGQATVLPPAESVRRMVLPEGYVVELVASEPTIRQPIDLRFDARGRLWVVEYLQYPFPAASRSPPTTSTSARNSTGYRRRPRATSAAPTGSPSSRIATATAPSNPTARLSTASTSPPACCPMSTASGC
jgi:hypothetical protein